MKLFDFHGKLVSVDVRQSSYPLKTHSRSKLQGIVGQYLIDKFPRSTILEDFTLPNSGRLSIDFFVVDQRLAIEIDGKQHSSHHFFHGDKNKCEFAKQVGRDMKKENWCLENNIKLIRVTCEDDIGKI